VRTEFVKTVDHDRWRTNRRVGRCGGLSACLIERDTTAAMPRKSAAVSGAAGRGSQEIVFETIGNTGEGLYGDFSTGLPAQAHPGAFEQCDDGSRRW